MVIEVLQVKLSNRKIINKNKNVNLSKYHKRSSRFYFHQNYQPFS